MDPTPLFTEETSSKLPALQLLMGFGWQYLTPSEASALRGGRRGRTVLDDVLAEWLRRHNTIGYRSEELPFSEANIHAAIEALADVPYDGLVRTNEAVYDLLCLGKSLPQAVRGDTRSFSLRYIDWEHPENNVYHVTEEFAVERRGGQTCLRPDIVLFVNGIPLVVIECKPPTDDAGKDLLPQAVGDHLAKWRDDGVPHLYQYSQLVLAVTKNEVRYATCGTPREYWARWREERPEEAAVADAANPDLPPQQVEKLLSIRPADIRSWAEGQAAGGRREPTEQDHALWALCRPERLLELAYRFVIYDNGEKKIARYQQYFCVRETMSRLLDEPDERGARRGGVVWHTQGSGKSLTMVMLAKAIALEPRIPDHKIVLVTDRVDLDDQIYGTFRACGREVTRARSGRHLAELLADPKAAIITTVIDKFETAVRVMGSPILDTNVFVLVDESHRSQYGLIHSRMRSALPRACFLGFTGTPVMKRDKSTVARFGGLIHVYNIEQAVCDQAVVPLIYEGRHVAQTVQEKSIDEWFGLLTEGLNEQQAADLKHRFSTTDQLNKAEQRVKRIAYDICRHWRQNWQGTGFKAQLVAPDKATALQYHRYLAEAGGLLGRVTSAVLISGPDEREGEIDTYGAGREAVHAFWSDTMDRYGNEGQYNKQLIQAFKHGDEPEIIIVVDKLLTGFDAPRNTVLYLCRLLRDHSLLQAIARVNRLCEGKEYGYILDYRGVLEQLNLALNIYAALPEFDAEDLEAYAATLVDISREVAELPQRHSDLWEVFKEVPNRYDEETYERLLADEALRVVFYDRLTRYARTLALALSSEEFLLRTPPARLERYQADLRFFERLRSAVRLRYAERVDYSQYLPRIRKLIDEYVGAEAVEQITDPVDIFDEDAFAREVERLTGDRSNAAAARADTIAHRALRSCIDHMQEDPAFYRRFSEMLKEAISDFRQERLAAAVYLRKVAELAQQLVHRTDEGIPEPLRHRDVAKAYFGCVTTVLQATPNCQAASADAGAAAAIAIEEAINKLRIVNWSQNTDRQNQMRTEIEDVLVDLGHQHGLDLSFDQIDEIIEEVLKVAKVRVP
ncbi:MAG: type I restriction endonuclease subunit R [Armatimonadetes bacterium]|nr:type I restriction endonuclease subunit R [Armatimonadota bacterium]